ncbi:MAG: site-specific integrase [Deltaproteobacteria bacterium]|nr:site-specific integrase [Deltaproteobacteria bacterium]
MQEIIEQFLRTYQGRLKPSTFSDYRSILRHHISQFSSFEALNQELEEYLASLAISGKRKNNILSATRSFVGWAKRRELWEGRFLRIPRFPNRSAKIKPLSPDEARLIMAHAPFPWRDYFQFAILTGVRTGEALGLQFKDFDLTRRRISIRRAVTRGKIVSPKSEAGEREIPLLRPVWEIYQRRMRLNEDTSPWFFYSQARKNRVISRKALARAWAGILKAFDIDPRPLYATRHTFASLSLAAGEDPLWVAKTMGHSRPDQLFLKYASYLEEVKPDGEKIIDLVLGKQSLMKVVP